MRLTQLLPRRQQVGSSDSSPRDSGGFSKPQEHVTIASRGMLSDAPPITSNGKHVSYVSLTSCVSFSVRSRFCFPPELSNVREKSHTGAVFFCQAAAFHERWQQTQIWLNGRNRAIKSRHLPTPGVMEAAEWAGCRNIPSQFRNWSCWRASSWILWLWNNSPNPTQAYFNNDASACRDFYCVFCALNVWTLMPL